ncbi:MAG: T9SS type A sorting domain-containing protein [Candidatus Eisenbacteria bacterium]|nr:T9SS type A sorting domain-containing protein [Candidatus Eisenbacteria bacterium]
MDVIFDGAYGTQVAPLKYHVHWPSATDQFYVYNPTEINARRSYYAVNYVPTFRWDGKYIKDPSDFGTYAQWYSFVRTTIDTLSDNPAPIRIEVEHYLSPPDDPDSIYIKIDVIAEEAVSGTLRLRCAIVQYWVRVVGQGKFYYPFRDMIPSTAGEVVPNLSAGDSLHFEYVVPYDSANYHIDRMQSTVWVQNDVGKAVLNAATGFIPQISTDVPGGVPLRVVLDQNMPNPFNPTTTIGFSVDQDGQVRLSVFSPTGRLVTDLVDGAVGEGSHMVTWDGRDRTGREVGSGVYYYRLDTDKTSLTKKMILVR